MVRFGRDLGPNVFGSGDSPDGRVAPNGSAPSQASLDPMNRDERTVFSVGAFAIALGAIFLAVFAIFIVNDEGTATSAGGGAAGAPAAAEINVELSEFALTPTTIDVPATGARLTISNIGNMAHNFTVPQLGLETGDIQPGGTATLLVPGDVGGTYDVICTIAGHADSGMRGIMNIGGTGATETADAGASEANDGSQPAMDPDEMDRLFLQGANSFPAKTEGHGGELMEPRIEDGVKVYDLTAEIVDWEISPGKIVKAWTYNGVVPAPRIELEVGDTVRINLQNNLPESTSIHFHGIRVPNTMDGVPPYTQPVVRPGDSYVYEFTTVEPAVGIYHSHMNGAIQLPNGLFGAFIIGEMPIPQVLQDKGITEITETVNMILNDAGTIGLSLNGKSFPGTEPYTLRVGETMMVHYYNEGLMSHPMHLHQPRGYIIAKDGIPLDVPMPGDTFNIAPGERYTVLYTATDPGVWAWHCHILSHAESPTGMFGMVTALIITA